MPSEPLFIASLVSLPGGSASAQPVAAPTPSLTCPAASGSGQRQIVRYTLDTPIEVIAADVQGKAVLEKDIPGLLEHPSYESFKARSLNEVAPRSAGALSDAMLKTTAADLLAIGC